MFVQRMRCRWIERQQDNQTMENGQKLVEKRKDKQINQEKIIQNTEDIRIWMWKV